MCFLIEKVLTSLLCPLLVPFPTEGTVGEGSVSLWTSTSPLNPRCLLGLPRRSSPVRACPQLPETAKRSIFVLFRKGVACNHLCLSQTRPILSQWKFKGKCISYIPPTILLHLPCPQSLSNWGKFRERKLCDKFWPNHKTQQELKVTKWLLTRVPWSPSGHGTYLLEVRGSRKPEGGGSWEDNLEKQSNDSQRTLLLFWVLYINED